MIIALFLGLIVGLSGTQAENNKLVEEMSIIAKLPPSDDIGVATNCGKSAVNAIWTPKDISPIGQVTAYVNITVPYDMNGGYGEIDIYNHTNGAVVAQYGTPFTCEKIKKWISCPLKKNQFLSMQKTITDLSVLAQYTGTYDIVIQVSNEQDQQILCMNATVTVTR